MTISLATVNRVMEQLGMEVVAACQCQEIKLSSETSTELCEAIERRWHTIRLGAYTDRDTSSAVAVPWEPPI